jgi:RNA polymerase sigma-70 factor (ECF subfamily)
MRGSPEVNPAPYTRDVADIARLAASGDTSSIARLLRIVAPEVLRVVRGVMGPYSSEVDDGVQQSLVGLIQALPAFRGECAPAGYACRIAFRTALGMRKRVHRLSARHDVSADADLLEGHDSPSAASEARRRTDLIRSMLNEIPTVQAEALAMRTMLGWSIDEIAQTTGTPVNTVRSRLRLAKEALRRHIEADPFLAEELGLEP